MHDMTSTSTRLRLPGVLAAGSAALALLAAPAWAREATALAGHDPFLGVVTTAGDTPSQQTNSAQVSTLPGMGATGLGVAAGGAAAVGVVAGAGGSGGGDGSDGSNDGSDDGDSTDSPAPGSGDGSSGDGDIDGGGDNNAGATPEDGSGPDEPQSEETSDGPLTQALTASQTTYRAVGGARLTLTRRGEATAWHLSQPVGGQGGYLTLTSGADPRHSGGFFAGQSLPADLLLRPGVMGATHLQGFDRLSGALASLPQGNGRLRLAAYAGQDARPAERWAPGGGVVAAGYATAAEGLRLDVDFAVAGGHAGQSAVSTGTRFAAELASGTRLLAGASAHAGNRAQRGSAVMGLTTRLGAPAGERRLGLIAARTWSAATERAAMSKTSGNGFSQSGSARKGGTSLQAFWQESLGARAELGLGTHWAPAYGDRPEHSATASFVAKLTGEF